MLIAIDGPAASGKGTVAKQIAAHYGLEYLDTGRLYRLVGWEMLKRIEAANKTISSSELAIEQRMLAINIAKNLDISQINNEEIETEEVGRVASQVSAIPEVRAALLDFQRRVAKNPKGAVLDGRDIGTVICPKADYKFFITAEPETRANRRFLQLKARGKKVDEADILRDILARDERDKGRDIAPLIMAVDAHFIDTTSLGVEAVLEKVVLVIDSQN